MICARNQCCCTNPVELCLRTLRRLMGRPERGSHPTTLSSSTSCGSQKILLAMSHMGQLQTCTKPKGTSALHPNADIRDYTAMSAKGRKQPYGLAPFRSTAVLIQVRKRQGAQ